MTIIATGIDLAKKVFPGHSVSSSTAVQARHLKVAHAKLNALIASLPSGLMGMEACSGAHYWARQFQAHGHTVRLMAPKLVTPSCAACWAWAHAPCSTRQKAKPTA